MPAASQQLDQKQAAEAYRKALAGDALTERERLALKRFERDREEQLRWKYYATIPQKHWRRMSGRQTKVLHEQAERYGLPFGGAAVDLPKLARALHDFLATNAHKLARDDDSLLTGPASPALERYREERAALARLDRLEREGGLVDRNKMLDGMARVAAIVRGAGDALQRQFGSGALDILLEALDEADREIGRTCAQPPGPLPAACLRRRGRQGAAQAGGQEQASERGT